MTYLLHLLAANADVVLHYVLAALGALWSFAVIQRVKSATAAGVLGRAYDEVIGAAREVYQVYVESLKQADEDGKITEAEAATARAKAWAIFKSNVGEKGLERLGRIVGVDVEKWFGSKLEGAVNKLKVEGLAAGGKQLVAGSAIEKLRVVGGPTSPGPLV